MICYVLMNFCHYKKTEAVNNDNLMRKLFNAFLNSCIFGLSTIIEGLFE